MIAQLDRISFSPAYDFNAWNDDVLGATDKAAHYPLARAQARCSKAGERSSSCTLGSWCLLNLMIKSGGVWKNACAPFQSAIGKRGVYRSRCSGYWYGPASPAGTER